MLEKTSTKSGPLPEEEFLEGTGHCAMVSSPEKILAIVMVAAEKGKTSTFGGADEEIPVSCL